MSCSLIMWPWIYDVIRPWMCPEMCPEPTPRKQAGRLRRLHSPSSVQGTTQNNTWVHNEHWQKSVHFCSGGLTPSQPPGSCRQKCQSSSCTADGPVPVERKKTPQAGASQPVRHAGLTLRPRIKVGIRRGRRERGVLKWVEGQTARWGGRGKQREVACGGMRVNESAGGRSTSDEVWRREVDQVFGRWVGNRVACGLNQTLDVQGSEQTGREWKRSWKRIWSDRPLVPTAVSHFCLKTANSQTDISAEDFELFTSHSQG